MNSSEFSNMDQVQEWTTSEKKLLKRLVRIMKYDVAEKFDVSPDTKDTSWRKLTKEFNRAVIRAYKIPRSTMELRLQWEKMTEKEFSRKTRRLLSRMYEYKVRKTRAQQGQPQTRSAEYYNYALSKFILLESSDEEDYRVKRRKTAARNEKASTNNDPIMRLITVKTDPKEGKDDDALELNRIETQICEIDAEFWTNKVERINAQCEMTGNKHQDG